jgi:hypothetical protein
MINKNELPILYLGDEFLLKYIFWNTSGKYSIFICIAVAQIKSAQKSIQAIWYR